MSGRPAAGVAAGLWRLALLRADGVACFSATPEGLLASFTPWLAIGIVFALVAASLGRPVEGLSTLLQLVCLVLAVPVVSHLVLRRWRLEAGWLRFATVYVWSQWLPNLLALVLGLVADVALAAGINPHLAVGLPIMGWIVYAVRLNWLVARVALGTGWGRTLLLLLCLGAWVTAIVWVPTLVGDVLQSSPAAPAVSAPPDAGSAA